MIVQSAGIFSCHTGLLFSFTSRDSSFVGIHASNEQALLWRVEFGQRYEWQWKWWICQNLSFPTEEFQERRSVRKQTIMVLEISSTSGQIIAILWLSQCTWYLNPSSSHFSKKEKKPAFLLFLPRLLLVFFVFSASARNIHAWKRQGNTIIQWEAICFFCK